MSLYSDDSQYTEGEYNNKIRYDDDDIHTNGSSSSRRSGQSGLSYDDSYDSRLRYSDEESLSGSYYNSEEDSTDVSFRESRGGGGGERILL